MRVVKHFDVTLEIKPELPRTIRNNQEQPKYNQEQPRTAQRDGKNDMQAISTALAVIEAAKVYYIFIFFCLLHIFVIRNMFI